MPLGFVRARVFALVAAWAAALPAGAAAAPLRVGADRPVDITHIRLDLAVHLEQKEIVGSATLSFTALRPLRSITFDAVDFQTTGVTLAIGDSAPQPADFYNDGKKIVITPRAELPTGAAARAKISYAVRRPGTGLHFFGPTVAEPDTPWQVWSQGESITNRHWFPCADHPNERQTTELIATVKTGYEVISNGALLSKKENAGAGTTTWHYKQDKPHVAYLVSLVVGKFAVQREQWRGKPVAYYVPPERADDMQRSFGDTLRMLDFYSERFGYVYPWAKYDQVVVEQFIVGGMENTSATTLNENTLHDAKADIDYSSEPLVAHELVHQWYGDLITCRDWAHLWLNEGFATYFEAVWDEHDNGPDEFAYNMYQKARRALDGGKAKPIVDRRWGDPWDQFDARSYPKGAWVLHMIRNRTGDDRFWKIIRTYTKRHEYGIVESTDFRQVCEEVTGRSFERFFYDWTERPGHPVVDVKYKWVADDKLASVTVKQTQKSEAFHFPVKLEFAIKDRKDPVVTVHEMTEKERSFHVPLPDRPVRFRFDPGFTVLKEEKINQGRDLWIEQLEADPDPIGRIQAAKHLGDAHADTETQALIDALKDEKFWAVQSAICAALGTAGGDKARDALIGAINLEHAKARRRAVESLGKFRDEPTVVAALEPIVTKGDASYYVEVAAIDAYAKLRPDRLRERLEPLLKRPSHKEVVRQTVLRGLAETRDPKTVGVLMEWTKRGKARDCRAAAMGALTRLARNVKLPDATLTEIVDRLSANLSRHETARVRTAAIGALRDLGDVAQPAVGMLSVVADQDPEGRVRTAARHAVDKIRTGTPPQVELGQLRKDLKELKDKNKKLEQRLDAIEGKTAR